MAKDNSVILEARPDSHAELKLYDKGWTGSIWILPVLPITLPKGRPMEDSVNALKCPKVSIDKPASSLLRRHGFAEWIGCMRGSPQGPDGAAKIPAFLQKEVGVGFLVRLDTLGDIDDQGKLPDSQPDSSQHGPLSASRDACSTLVIGSRGDDCREEGTELWRRVGRSEGKCMGGTTYEFVPIRQAARPRFVAEGAVVER